MSQLNFDMEPNHCSYNTHSSISSWTMNPDLYPNPNCIHFQVYYASTG